MTKLNLKDFERRLKIRTMLLKDFPQLVVLQQKCFPGMKPWIREQIESQLRHFPEGQLVVEYRGRIVASSSSLVVDFEQYEDWHDWKVIADAGFIRNHDPKGDTLYGIEIMVDPDYRGMKLARRLYNERKRICKELNLKRIVVGGRIPGYGGHASRMSAREYVEQVMEKKLVDPVLTPQLSNGFRLRELIPGYFPADSESRGYATHLEWVNLDYAPPDRPPRHMLPKSVRICVVQYQMRPVKDWKDFARQTRYFVDVASDYRSDFVLFPELFTTQLLSFLKAPRPALAARRVAEFTPQYLDHFSKLAVRYDVNIVGGSTFTVENDRLYNISYLFRRDGTLEKQYKLHITPAERRWWGVVPGPSQEVFETDRGPVAIQICYDVEFPELARIAASKGARLLFVPFNTDERYAYLRVRHCALARCVENHVYAAIAGCVGNLPFVDNADIHYAESGIFTPSDLPFDRDAIAALCTANIETLIIHDVDPTLLPRHAESGTVQNWQDRRRDLYSVRWKENGETKEV